MDFLELIKVIILGVIEGITEWLPISSTGHMILVDEFIHLNMSKEFMEMFFVVIQLGAIIAVIVLFFDKLFPFSFKKNTSFLKKDIMSLWGKVIVAVLPAAIIGLPFEDTIDKMFYNYKVVALTLIIYGVLFIIIENRKKDTVFQIQDMSQLTYKVALYIGLFQVLSLIPGTSRSGATIVGAMLVGTSRVVAAEFTFYLAIPVMFGASFIKLLKFGLAFTSEELAVLIIGMVVAFVVSILSIKFLTGYVKKHDFKIFGYYRIVLGLIVIFYFILQ